MKRLWKDRVAGALAAVLVLLVAVEAVLVSHSKPVFPWHAVPGYAAGIGLLGCVLVVQVSKVLGKAFLQEPEDG